MRPLLLPGLARVWRGPRTLQLGADPAHALLVDLPDARAADLLDLLDGSRPFDHPLVETLRSAGLVLPAAPPDRLLGEATALALTHADPAEALSRRASARVVLRGHGRLAAPVAVALAMAGVGHVRPDLTGTVSASELAGGPLREADVGRAWAEAVTDALARAVPEVKTSAVRREAASLLIQLGYAEPVALVAARHARRRQPHLALTVREGVAIIGPYVPAAGSPCLNCVDLQRRERDPGWPAGYPAAEPCGVVTVLAATALATAEALAVLDGEPPETAGASVEISRTGRRRRRTWRVHPDCGCDRPNLDF